MQQHIETRLLFGGIDSDTMPQFIDDKTMLNSINVRTTINNDQTTGAAEFIAGNDLVGNFGDGSQFYQLLGKCTDEEKEVEYLFFYSALQFGRVPAICRYDKKLNAISLFFDESNVTGGLRFVQGSFISARAANGQLIWTDGVNPQRYLNTNRTYTGQITQEELSLIVEPGHVPLTQQRQDNPSVTTQIQEQPLQFSYRFINQDNETSVLAPYSLTALPVRQSALTASASAGNVVDIKMDFDQKIPDNWKTVEFVVRYINSNTFFVIRQWNKAVAADAAAVSAHNAGTTQLSDLGWTGTSIFTIDAATASKEFDVVPITSNFVELADNRLLLAGNKDGYDTALVKPGYSLVQNSFLTSFPSSAIQTPYLIFATTEESKNNAGIPATLYKCYYAIIYRFNNKNYLLPQDFSIGTFWGSDGLLGTFDFDLIDPEYAWNIPINIASSAVIEMKEAGDPDLTNYNGASSAIRFIRQTILEEANNVKPTWHDTTNSFLSSKYLDFNLFDAPSEFGTLSESRAFAANNTYKIGLQLYDQALRKSGVINLQELQIPSYGPYTKVLENNIQFTITASTGTPTSWAYFYAITMSKNQKALRVINFIPNIIKVVAKNISGDIKFGGNSFLTVPPTGYTVYGLAVAISSISPYNYGYAFTQGDFIELVGFNAAHNGDTQVVYGSVIDTLNGYIIMQYDTSKYSQLDNIICDANNKYEFITNFVGTSADVSVLSAIKRQDIVFATLYNGATVDTDTYEVAKFGIINNPGQANRSFGVFFDSGTLTTSMFGDMYTQKRESATGAYTGISYTTNEVLNSIPVNDTGRITPIDTVGQKNLPTAIRWSNTNIPGTNTNGYATFDAEDFVIVDQTTGPITMMILTTKGVQEAAQLVITCTAGSYVALVGKQQIVDSGQGTAFTSTTAQVIGTINPIQGNWGCQSPRSVVQFQGHVWWVDWINQSSIEFNASGATKISGFKANRLWKLLCSRLTAQSDVNFIKAAVNPYSSEVLFTIPAPNATSKAVLPTTTLEDPLDCYYNKVYTYIFNYEENVWKGIYQSDKEFFHIGWDLYSVRNATFAGDLTRLYHEMNGQPGVYYGVNQNAMIVVPFNSQYPMVKSPLTIRVSADRPPDQTWLVSQDGNAEQVASTSDYIMREGDAQGAILRDRLSNNASSAPQWAAAGINGVRLKGKTIVAVLIWFPENGTFTASSVTLEYQQASGH